MSRGRAGGLRDMYVELDPQPVWMLEVPLELADILDGDAVARRWFERLSYREQRDYIARYAWRIC